MNKTKESNWNNFWAKEKQKQSGTLSWSKRRIIKTITPYLVKGQKALDAGCGSGFFSKFFCDQGMVTTALDYSDEALALAEQLTKGEVNIVKQDLTSENLHTKINDRFSLIFSDGLLEHFSNENQETILRNLRNLLDDNGAIITFVPNRFSPWEIIRPFVMPGIDETPFILGTLNSVHKKSGLMVVESGGINTLPFALSPDKILGRYFGMLLYTIAKKE